MATPGPGSCATGLRRGRRSPGSGPSRTPTLGCSPHRAQPPRHHPVIQHARSGPRRGAPLPVGEHQHRRREHPGAGLGRVGVDDRDRVGRVAHQRDTARIPGITDAAPDVVSAEPLLLQRVHYPAHGVLTRFPKARQRNPGGPALALVNRQDPAHHTTGYLLKPKAPFLRIAEPPRRPGHLLLLIQLGFQQGILLPAPSVGYLRRLLRPAPFRFLPSARRLLRLLVVGRRAHAPGIHPQHIQRKACWPCSRDWAMAQLLWSGAPARRIAADERGDLQVSGLRRCEHRPAEPATTEVEPEPEFRQHPGLPRGPIVAVDESLLKVVRPR